MQQVIVILIGIAVFLYVIWKIVRFIRKSRKGEISCSSCAPGCSGCPLKNEGCNEKPSDCCRAESGTHELKTKKRSKRL